jgi:hypothetical protein
VEQVVGVTVGRKLLDQTVHLILVEVGVEVVMTAAAYILQEELVVLE